MMINGHRVDINPTDLQSYFAGMGEYLMESSGYLIPVLPWCRPEPAREPM
jgi:hypothetical protein